MADRVLAAVRRIFNWHAARTDNFTSPIVRGMRENNATARNRTLSDEEIKAVWAACNAVEPPIFGAMVRMLMLTAQRRGEVAGMRWSEIEGEAWTIPAERYKTKRENVVPLSRPALALLETLDRAAEYVFTAGNRSSRRNGTGHDEVRPFGNVGDAKRALDSLALDELRKNARRRGEDPRKAKLPRWTLHDLRRTAKTLMSAENVRPDISERILGHTITGV